MENMRLVIHYDQARIYHYDSRKNVARLIIDQIPLQTLGKGAFSDELIES